MAPDGAKMLAITYAITYIPIAKDATTLALATTVSKPLSSVIICEATTHICLDSTIPKNGLILLRSLKLRLLFWLHLFLLL